MNKKKRTIVWIVILIIILAGTGGAGSIYYFFAKQLQLTKTIYIYIDRDDNLDSVYHKISGTDILKICSVFNIWQKKKYGDNIRTGRCSQSIGQYATSSGVFLWDIRLPLI